MNLILSPVLRRFVAAAALCVAGGVISPACGGGGSSGAAEITFKGSSDLFPGFHFDTGLQPPSSPVQASFALTASGKGSVTAVAAPSGSEGDPALTGLPGKGTLQIDGSFALVGQLEVDLSSVSSLLPKYDGPIPGLDNISISVKGEEKFDPFSIKKATTAHAPIPPTTLPKIPLPGGIPGHLVLAIAEGSVMDLTFTGTCAGADGTNASYSGVLARSGQLVIQPSVEIDLGSILGTKSYDIPAFTVPLSLGESDLPMTAKIQSFGDRPEKGDTVTGSCGPTTGTGGSGTGGSGTGGSGTGGHGGNGGGGGGSGGGGGGTGICGSTLTYSDPTLDACVGASCCAELSACTKNGADEAGCIACINNVAGGPQCDAFLACADPCRGAICNSGLALPGFPEVAACLSTNCCAAFNACTSNGADPQACNDCLMSGGGPGTICDAAIQCNDTACPPCVTDADCASPKTCQNGVCL